MKKILFLLIILYGVNGYSQDIVSGEYFIDTEPGLGNGTPISVDPSDSISVDINISTIGLSQGYHHLYTRFKMDNGEWGLLHAKMFHILSVPDENTIVSGEYFIDSEPGLGNGIPISVMASDSVDVDLNISIASLNPGFHYLYFRFKSIENQWGLLQRKMFYILPTPTNNTLVAGEYFIDTEPGLGNGIPFEIFSPTDSVEQDFSLQLPELALGQHTLYLRYINENGDWGMLEQRPFTVCTDYGTIANFSTTTNDDVAFFYNESQYQDNVKWDFGDGNITTEHNPSHLYTDAGVYDVKLVTYNECANDSITHQVHINGIKAMTPHYSAHTNFILATISGAGFEENMEVKLLRNGEEIIGTNANSNGSNSLTVNFNFENETIGFWDVVVTAPGIFSDTLLQGFQMQPMLPSNLSTYISAPQRVLAGRHQRFVVNVANEGNKTEIGIQHFVRFPKTNIQARLLSEMKSPNLSDHLLDSLLTGLRGTLDPISGDSIYSGYYIIPILGPGETTSLIYDVYASSPASLNIKSAIGKSIFTEAEKIQVINGITNFSPSVLTSFVGRSTNTPVSALNSNFSITNLISNLINGVLTGLGFNSPTPAPVNSSFQNSGPIVYTALPVGCSGCGQQGVPANPGGTAPVPASTQVAHYLFDPFEIPNEETPWEFTEEELADWILDHPETEEPVPAEEAWEFTEEELQDALNEDLGDDLDEDQPDETEEEPMTFTPEELCSVGICGPITPIDDNDGDEEDEETTNFVTSMDPNAIYGPLGFTAEQYVNDNLRMDYRVEFENADTAQANAAIVELLLPLDTAAFDLSTFRFETFGFSEALYTLAPYRESFTAELSIENLHPCIVRITGFAPDSTGLARILFESLDFETRELVSDPDGGFLPPNIDAPEGQAFMTYSIRQKENLPSLTEIDAVAEIIFDSNEGIITNLHQNIVDADNPSSTILPLQPIAGDPMLTLHFDKQDGESGVDYLDVYISINSGSFQHITRTNVDSALFQMETGTTYAFYTVATDFCGNREEDTGLADVTISYEVRIDENDMTTQLTLFPIPAHDMIVFELDLPKAAEILYEVTDMTGKTVIASKRLNTSSNTIKQSIDISELAAGIYLFQVKAGEHEFTRKLIKQ